MSAALTTGRKKARIRCGECEACKRPDCGTCESCSKKRKFGGDGTSKHACIHRRCTNLQERPSAAAQKKSLDDNTNNNNNNNNFTSAAFTGIYSPYEPPLRSLPKLLADPGEAKQAPNGSSTTSFGTGLHPRYRYGLDIPPNTLEVCAGCLGKRDDIAADEPILLCDGRGCSNEYHLKCCIPPLAEVPDGSYYCIDCHPKGATHSLESYFEDHDDKRSDHKSSMEYLEWLLKQDLEEHAKVPSPQSKMPIPQSSEDDQIPQSELCRIQDVLYLIMKKPSAAGKNSANTNGHTNSEREKFDKELPADSFGPDFFVGKPIRMHCPYDNTYHCGRIVDYRPAMKDENETTSEVAAAIGTDTTLDNEYLIRFPAGKDYRKETLHRWVRLEEHSLALGSHMIWGKYKNFQPAMVLLRTARELVPVKHMLREEAGEIIYPSTKRTSSMRLWALAKRFGEEEDGFKLLFLQDESIELFTSHLPHQRSRNKTLYALAMAEFHEQERVEKWRSMQLLNPAGPKALTALDEYSLEPLGQIADGSLCPLIPQGLDRSYLLDRLVQRDAVSPNKDVASNMEADLSFAPPN